MFQFKAPPGELERHTGLVKPDVAGAGSCKSCTVRRQAATDVQYILSGPVSETSRLWDVRFERVAMLLDVTKESLGSGFGVREAESRLACVPERGRAHQ